MEISAAGFRELYNVYQIRENFLTVHAMCNTGYLTVFPVIISIRDLVGAINVRDHSKRHAIVFIV